MVPAGTGALQVFVRVVDFVFCLVSQLLHAVPPVERAPDLLVGLHEALQLDRQVFILAEQDVAVVLQRIDFGLDVHVLCGQRLVREPQVRLLATALVQVVFANAALAVQLEQGLRQTSVTVLLCF